MQKYFYRLLLILLAILLFSMPATAAVHEGAFSVMPQVGWLFNFDYQDQNDAPMTGLALGYQYSETSAVELFGGLADDILQTRLDYLYHFDPEEQLVPYLAGGIGLNFVDGGFTQSDSTDLLLNLGGGLKYAMHDNIDLRADLRAIASTGGFQVLATAGLNFPFGWTKDAPAPTEMATPAATPPPPPAKKESPKKMATAPAAAAAAPMAAAPMDSDGDGVPDDKDKCPGTAKGVPVDEFGCVLTLTIRINFDFDKAVIKPEFTKELDKAAAFINKYDAVNRINLDGHTCNIGTESYNQSLSERRAKAVADALVNFYGIDQKVLFPRGFGETRPISDNATLEGRRMNRRVDIVCCSI
ncbi:MAG: hypothetical protein C0616_04935 [Desulfuromonas sp.]|nr:MAG: hypothetical protein C0616_04935 [Desulfuromonas sp.]